MRRKKFVFISLATLLTAVLIVTIPLSGCGQEKQESEPEELLSSQSSVLSDSNSSNESQSSSEEENQAPQSITSPPSGSSASTVSQDSGYFSDALFVGDSLTNGLYLYGDIETADYCYETSATAAGVTSVTPLLSMLSSKNYGKIYILLGINEMGSQTSSYIANYEKLIDTIRSYQPNATIVVQTILPTNPAMTWSASVFSVENVQEKNRALADLASRKGAVLLDTYSAYADENGMMPASYCRDGVHPHESYYSIWCDYLRSHTV